MQRSSKDNTRRTFDQRYCVLFTTLLRNHLETSGKGKNLIRFRHLITARNLFPFMQYSNFTRKMAKKY
ncbi:hypothetical protein EUGRSUZ_L03334 [Eucalyptus grandis]|uniref:Uncharacterized protein n=1 Tax=Eucalyptus grandis TaxID=71139 RepID=A0AAD9T7H3_EUCGR|nr:hypothetical protein EUGRSUZ_L03334 [Eucalyptus grandis]